MAMGIERPPGFPAVGDLRLPRKTRSGNLPGLNPRDPSWRLQSHLLNFLRGFILALLVAGISAPPLVAQPVSGDAKAFSGFALAVEQDRLFNPWNEDRNYTMGVGFGFAGELGYDKDPVFTPWRLTALLPLIREGLDRSLLGIGCIYKRMRAGTGMSEYSWTFGTTAFTPDDLANPDPILDDRPYASLMFLSTRRVRVDARDEAWALSSDFTLGVLGLGVAEAVQTWIHEGNTSDVPMGWKNQISEGGELTGMYGLKYQRRPRSVNDWFSSDDFLQLEWTWHGLGQLGYYVAAEAGFSVRAGRFQSEFWQWASNPLNSQNEALRALKQDCEYFAFAALRGRGVHHNSLLEGQFRESVVTVDAEPWIAEGEAGLSGSCLIKGRRIGLTWVTIAGRTPEFKAAGDRRNHWWGSVFATVRFGS